MKHTHSDRRGPRAKAIGIALAGLIGGIGLIVLSRLAVRSAQAAATQPAATQQAQVQPATQATATAPSSAPAGEAETPTSGATPKVPRPDSKVVAAQHLASLLLLFGLMGIGLSVVCAGWVVYDVRRSRPAWKTQHKYPVRIPPKKLKR